MYLWGIFALQIFSACRLSFMVEYALGPVLSDFFFRKDIFLKLFSGLRTDASGHTVHCLGHDSISGPAIGPFFSMFI